MIEPQRMTGSTFYAALQARLDSPMEYVRPSDDWRVKLRAIARNYARYQKMVDAGHAEWIGGDPYEIADWAMLFTPIEYAVWGDIRRNCLPMWPQLPVGRYFVDFGNPVFKIAIECDGEEFHDAVKDAERDHEMRKMGWTVHRIPGWQCLNHIEEPFGLEEMTEEDQAAHWRLVDEKTTRRLMRQLREIMHQRSGEVWP